MNTFMEAALKEAYKNIDSNEGGPFGAAVVKDKEIIAVSRNSVVSSNDPTMHAEVSAIRKAAAILGRYDLSDCELYTTCEPCIMCLGAIYWARIPKIYYGTCKADAEKIGFDDKKFYDSIQENCALIDTEQIGYEECSVLFDKWAQKANKAIY